MSGYLKVLARRDFRRLWLGASVSLIGDGMTLVALSWLVLNGPGGVGGLGFLAFCYTAPVLVGGWLAGPLLDRFDKRIVLAADSLIRAGAVGSVPLAAVFGEVPGWLPFVVAISYGLLKMVPLAGVPAAIPDLVDSSDLDAANALESLGYAVSGVVGFSLAGWLVGALGAAEVLALDAATFLFFAIAVLMVRRPLKHAPESGESGLSHGPSQPSPRMSALRRDPVLVRTTLAFMAFNVAEGALILVLAPWLAKDLLPGGPGTLALLLAALSVGELAGGLLAGAWHHGHDRVRAIAGAQIVAAVGFLAVLAVPHRVVIAVGFALIGMLGVLMTVWAQSLRMERVPARLRGRAFSTLRTLMQATPPMGALAVAPLLAHGRLTAAVLAMTALAALPALALLPLRATPMPAVPEPVESVGPATG